MALTDNDREVLRALEKQINSVAFVAERLAKRTFVAEDYQNIGGLKEALDDCRHELLFVHRLDQ